MAGVDQFGQSWHCFFTDADWSACWKCVIVPHCQIVFCNIRWHAANKLGLCTWRYKCWKVLHVYVGVSRFHWTGRELSRLWRYGIFQGKQMQQRVCCTGFLLSFIITVKCNVAIMPMHKTLKLCRRYASKLSDILDLNTIQRQVFVITCHNTQSLFILMLLDRLH
jgi:hypothetical protein